MYFTDAEITANGTIKYYYPFNYAEDHGSYPLTASYTKRLLKLYGVDSVIAFLSIGADQKSIYYWLVEHNKDRLSQTWPGPQTFFVNPYNIISMIYKEENDYIIVLFTDENPVGTFNLKAYTRKLTFNAASNPTSYTIASGNTSIDTKHIIDTFSLTISVSSYTSNGNVKGVFMVTLNKDVYSYHWDFVGQNRMLHYYIPDVITSVYDISYYMDFIIQHSTTDGVSDNFFVSHRSASMKSGILKLKDSRCLGFGRDLYSTKCFYDCPEYEEYDYVNKMCKVVYALDQHNVSLEYIEKLMIPFIKGRKRLRC